MLHSRQLRHSGPHKPTSKSAEPLCAHTARRHSRSSRRQRQRGLCLSRALPEDEDAYREKVKSLTKLFYSSTADATSSSSSSSSAGAAGGRGPQPRQGRVLKGSRIPELPLWRVEWAVLPGMQQILHVLAPHYVHMFEGVFSNPRPWVFGHLLLPGGSKSLGLPTHSLTSGSQAPLVGVLMQVTRAVRLRDGKFLVLATALGRFKVVRPCRELPFSTADVELLEDCEVLEGLGQAATAAVLQAAGDEASVSGLMAAATAAAREAAAAQHWSWARGYELKVAAGQEWPGPGPCEGESDMETYNLVQLLAAQGVADVLPLPDGVVIGRCNLEQVAADAAAAAQQALEETAAQLMATNTSAATAAAPASSSSSSSESQQLGAAAAPQDPPQNSGAVDGSSGSSGGASSSPSSSLESAGDIVSLNTVSERGVALQAPEAQQLTSSVTSCGSLADVLMLEAAIWQQLDVLAALSSRVKGRRHTLPFGLLQLRPPRPQMSVAAATVLANQAAAAAAAAAASSQGGAGAGDSGSGGGGAAPASAAASADSEQYGGSSSTSGRVDATGGGAPPTPPAADDSSSTSDPTTASSSSSSTRVDPGSSSRPSEQQQWADTAARYAFAASEGTDVHADPLWPPLRRAARLSWAAALVTGEFDLDKGPATSDMRQALLETTSLASRLRYVLAVLQKHGKVLAALAAVKDVQQEQ